jgi:Fic family protein
MSVLKQRSREILAFIQSSRDASNKEILEKFPELTRTTLYRELDRLVEKGFLTVTGKGRNVRYHETIPNVLLGYIDPEVYFSIDPDKRRDVYESYQSNVLKKFFPIFTDTENKHLDTLTQAYKKRFKTFGATLKKKEFERLTIELAWKSSRIEGNTYSLIDTEILIKEHKEAHGHTKAEARMILNHKAALEYIRDEKTHFRKLTLLKIRNVHNLLVKGLDVETNVRSRAVGITGTRYKPLDNQHQIRDALQEMISVINQTKNVFEKSVAAMLMLAYIQPFEDGNKRTSRLIGNALLLSHGACPLSFRSIDEGDYKKAMLLFYEQNNMRFFKQLFMEQYAFAVDHYFLV